MKRFVLVVLVVLLVSTVAVVSLAKEPIVKEPATTNPRLDLKITILPFGIEGARDKTKEMLPELYKTIFDTKGFDVTMGVPVEQTMRKLNIRTSGIPTSKELLQIGESMGVDYVLFASHKFETKRIWVNLLPRARSLLTLDPMIVNVKLQEVVYCPKDKIGYVHGGSNLQTGVGWVLFYPAALFMGGSLGDAEKKTAEKTIGFAYNDFFSGLVEEKNVKIKIK